MPSNNRDPRLSGLGGPALKNPGEDIHGEFLGEADDVEGDQGLAPHGIDVGEGIGRRNLAKPEGIIHHRGEIVHGLHQGLSVIDPVGRAVVGRICPDDQIGIVDLRQLTQNLGQVRRTEFAGSTRAVRELRETNLLGFGHGFPFLMFI